MPRLMDVSIERLQSMLYDMALISQNSVAKAIESYQQGKNFIAEVHASSEQLRTLQDEVSELAMEIIARYQPVARDLRFIRSCMEIAYGFSRFGRYAYDIAQVLDIFGDLSRCDKDAVSSMSSKTMAMIQLSIRGFIERDATLGSKLREMDDEVDSIYRNFVASQIRVKHGDLPCSLSTTLILRYLERIADHATYIGGATTYIVSGERTERN